MNMKLARTLITIKRGLFLLRNELIRFAQLGMHMLSASRTTTSMREIYEELGKKTYVALKDNRVHFDSEEEQQNTTLLSKRIEGCLKELDRLEEEVKHIKSQKSSYR